MVGSLHPASLLPGKVQVVEALGNNRRRNSSAFDRQQLLQSVEGPEYPKPKMSLLMKSWVWSVWSVPESDGCPDIEKMSKLPKSVAELELLPRCVGGRGGDGCCCRWCCCPSVRWISCKGKVVNEANKSSTSAPEGGSERVVSAVLDV